MLEPSELIWQVGELQPLPASSVRLSQLMSDADYSIEEVQEVIAFDQALTLKLLRAANSAVSGGAAPVGSVGDAVFRMGGAQVLALVIAAGAKPFLQGAIPAFGLDEGALWRHSVAAAIGAEIAPRFCPVQIPPDAFTAALLHDVGKLFLGRLLKPEVLKLVKDAREKDNLDSLEAETRILKFHHGELGGMIAEHWKLPARVVHGIRYHHTPTEGNDVICDVTYLANHIAKSIEAGLDGKAYDTQIDPAVASRLGMTEQTFEELWPAAISRYSRVRLQYNAM